MDLVEARVRGAAGGGRHPWERARLATVERLIGRHLTLRPGDAVIDVGCGDTFVTERLAHRYPDVQFHAVDSAFTDDLIADYRQRLNAPNVSLFASLDEVTLHRPAALVLLMDVLEHVPDDRALLRDVTLRSAFGGDTVLLITVPAHQWLFCSHDRFLGHYRRYSMGALTRLIDVAGLARVETGHLFATLLPMRALQVVRERLAPPRTDPPTDLATWNGSETVAGALAALLTLDATLALALARIGVRIPGLSNFAICRKSA